MNIHQIRARARELNAEVQAKITACENGDISVKALSQFMESARTEDSELADQMKAYNNAVQFGNGGGGTLDGDGTPPAGAGGSFAPSNGSDNGKRLTFGTKTTGALATKMLGHDGLRAKALAPSGSAMVDQEFRPDPIALGKPAHSLLDVLPVVPHDAPEFAYLRQITRTNNAAVVADYATKPTSVYGVERIEDKLDIVAHLSEAVPRYWMEDNASVQGFLANELDYGLRVAVEAKVVADIEATSGLQTVAYVTSPLVTLRKSLTKLETAGYEPGYFLLDPVDWEGIELLLTTTGATDVQGIPYDPAARRLFGVPVVVSVAQTAGVSHTVARGAVALDTDNQGTGVQWSENSNATDWSQNLIRARCEGRFATSVYAPLGVVVGDLAA